MRERWFSAELEKWEPIYFWIVLCGKRITHTQTPPFYSFDSESSPAPAAQFLHSLSSERRCGMGTGLPNLGIPDWRRVFLWTSVKPCLSVLSVCSVRVFLVQYFPRKLFEFAELTEMISGSWALSDKLLVLFRTLLHREPWGPLYRQLQRRSHVPPPKTLTWG